MGSAELGRGGVENGWSSCHELDNPSDYLLCLVTVACRPMYFSSYSVTVGGHAANPSSERIDSTGLIMFLNHVPNVCLFSRFQLRASLARVGLYLLVGSS